MCDETSMIVTPRGVLSVVGATRRTTFLLHCPYYRCFAVSFPRSDVGGSDDEGCNSQKSSTYECEQPVRAADRGEAVQVAGPGY